MPALAVIPARYGSTRFPGKPLAERTGKPLIRHVVERVRMARGIGRIVVATDDPRIADAVRAFGCEAMMTGEHPNGTSRIAEVVTRLGAHVAADDLIVNVQGDEPEIEPRVIEELIEGLSRDPDAPMATLAADFAADEDPANPNIVKLVVSRMIDATGSGSAGGAGGAGTGRLRAMYFSRALIPFDRDKTGVKPLKHPGLYAYRRDFLLKYVTLPPTPCEQSEALEQLRALEHGYAIAVIKADVRHHGIDTPQQYEAFVRRCRGE